jgi:KDO2-lipid IV(A) lauroyltransferase
VWRAIYLGVYLAFRACLVFIRVLPITVVFLLGCGAGEVLYWLLWRRRRLALANLRRAFRTAKTPKELRTIARAHFRLLCANILSGFKIRTMSHEKVLRRITTEKPASLEVPPAQARTGWVAMISHLSNWEVFGLMTSLLPEYRFGAVYQKLANPYVDRYLRDAREKSGIALFERRETLLRSTDFLRAGGVVGVLVDQSAGSAGLWTTFFGRLASCSTLASVLAVRTESPILPVAIYTCGLARWKVVASEPIRTHGEDIPQTTALINRQLEIQVAKSPADWLWSHNRWKALRPHFLLPPDERRYFLPPGCSREDLDRFQILFQSPLSLSQAKCSIPAVHALKKGRPDTFIAVLSHSPLIDFWKSVPDVDEVMEFRGTWRTLLEFASFRRFDAAIVVDPCFWNAIALRLAGVPIRVGYRRTSGSWFYNQFLPDRNPAEQDTSTPYLRMARSVGAEVHIG